MAGITGSALREWRRAAGWDIQETARRLRRAAAGGAVPEHDSLVRQIRRWEAGDSGVSERYELLYRVALGQAGAHAPDTAATLADFTASDLAAPASRMRGDLASLRRGEMFIRAAEQAAFGLPVIFPEASRGSAPVTEDQAVEVEIAAALFRSWDNAQGGGLRRKAVIGQLAEVASLLDGPFATDQAARRLYSAVADLAQLAGWMSWDLQMQGTAQQYYLLALTLARDAGDRAQVARMMYCLARQQIDLADPAAALDLAAAGAYAIGRGASPKATALVHAAQARALAGLGDERGCRSEIEAAFTAYARNGADPQWCGFFSSDELAGLAGVILRDLAGALPGHAPRIAAEARTWIEQAAAARPDSYLRSKVLDTDGIALASLLAGEPDRAAAAAGEAVVLSGRVHSPRAAGRVLSTITFGRSAFPGAAPWDDLAEQAKALLRGR